MSLPLPTSFEEYRIAGELGRGGMGAVYLAHDPLLDRAVAIKVIGAAQPSAQLRERFFLEARALARLQHPNVVSVYRVGEFEGRPFLVSEFVRGQSLKALRKPIPWRRALEIGIGLSRGLAATHRAGLLHRDLKPANALLTDDGTAKLIDFGLAKLLGAEPRTRAPAASPALAAPTPEVAPRAPSVEDTLESDARPLAPSAPGDDALDPSLTRAGAVLGSPLYMPPEAWRGEPPSRAGDVYSLGAVLYELCSGVAPFSHVPQVQLPEAIAAQPAPPLAGLAPDVDPRFAEVVDRCLSRIPGERPIDGEALREALERLERGLAGLPIPEGNPYRGLLAFQAEHRSLFFGRDAEVRAVLDRLRAERAVLVTADSGVGKSSLCRAGVLPAVAAGALGPKLEILSLVPGAHPLRSLAAALAPVLGRAEAEVLGALQTGPHELGRALRHARPSGLLLFIDQLEELVTLAAPQQAVATSRALEALALETAGVRLFCTVRSDHYVRIAALPGLGEAASRGLYLLRPLSDEGRREAVAGPAAATGVTFVPPGLVDQLAEAAARGQGALPLLQFALSELWERRDPVRQTISAASLAELGGVEGCLARHADGVLAALLPREREASRRLLLRLSTDERTRVPRSAHELGAEDPAVRGALDALVRGRLVIARAAETGDPVYELAHEALLERWETLRALREGGLEERLVHARLERAALEWERLGRPADGVLAARQLDEAKRLSPELLGPRDRALIAASERTLAARTRLRWGLRVGLPLLALVAVLPLAKVRYDRRHSLALYAREVADLTEQASRDAREAASARAEAEGRFERGELSEGERAWSRALEAERQALSTFARAEALLERATLLDAHSPELRGARAAVIGRTVELLRAFNRFPLAGAALARLAPDSPERTRLTAPAPVSLATDAGPARFRLEPQVGYGIETSSGREAIQGQLPWSGALGPGLWRLELELPGFEPARLPFVVRSGEAQNLSVPLVERGRLPAGFVYVPPGRSFLGSADDEELRRTFFNAQPLRPIALGPYLIGRHEVTLGEWIEYLEHLPEPERSLRRPNRPNRFNGVSLERTAAGWRLTLEPSNQKRSALAGELVHFPGRDRRRAQNWLRFPVSAISFLDAQAYARWLDATGRVPGARLCTDVEWERAARGADARRFPSGDAVDRDALNIDVTYGRRPDGFGPDEVGSHPASRSPFGVDDLSGNVWEMTVAASDPSRPILRGGSWYQGELTAVLANREPSEANNREPLAGIRLCATAPLGGAARDPGDRTGVTP